jgi:acetyltransferase-like isoleucine patch superfamily enzyme
MIRLIWLFRAIIYRLVFGWNIFYLGKPILVLGGRKLIVNRNLGIYPNARIEIGKHGKIEIGSDVRIGQSLFMQTDSKIIIGDNVTISANVFIGTTDYLWSKKDLTRLKNREEIERPIYIDEGVFLGVGCVVLPGAHLSRGCVVGANTVVKGFHSEFEIIK